jgi:mxaD protein
MNRLYSIVVLAGLLAAAPAVAQEAPLLSTRQSIRIAAPPEVVWSYVGDFGGIARWFKVIDSSRLVFKSRNEPGAIRELVRRNGTRVREQLVDLDPWRRSLSYTYADGAVMAADYLATITVNEVGEGASEVLWEGRFRRLDYGTDPAPPGQEDATVTGFFETAYKRGLDALKETVEQR